MLMYHQGDARPLAGGQSLVPMMAMRLVQPTAVVDLNEIPGLDEIGTKGDHLMIGSLTRYSKVETGSLIREHAPLLSDAVRHVGDRFIRNRGTLGGALAQADPSGEAVLAVMLLDGWVEVLGKGGPRVISASSLIEGPYQTGLGLEEVISAICIPLRPGRRHAFHEVQRRHGDYAVVSVGILGERHLDGSWHDVRIGVGAVGEIPLLFPEAARIAEATDLGEDVCRVVAEAVASATQPVGGTRASADYRLHLTRVWVERLLRSIAEGRSTWSNGGENPRG